MLIGNVCILGESSPHQFFDRVALRNDSYTLHKILPNKVKPLSSSISYLFLVNYHEMHGQVDPLVSLMMVEKVPDSTYEMVGGLDKQIKEIKEVHHVAQSSEQSTFHKSTMPQLGDRAASETP